MTDPFSENSVRAREQLLTPDMPTPIGHVFEGAPKTEDNSPPEKGSQFTDQFEGMVHVLRARPSVSALLIESHTTETPDYSFPTEEAYRQIAMRSGLFIKILSQPVAEGTRHMLFLGRVDNLTDAEYLACIPNTGPTLI